MRDGSRQILVGVDIGGTFTDIVLIDSLAGRVGSTKTLTTPEDPARGVLDGIARVLAQGDVQIELVNTVVHGTTLATNAIIERKGASTALLTTKGFRDLLETGTELRYDQYDLAITFPRPLVPRRFRFGVSERTRYDGEVLQEVSEADVADAVHRIASEGIQSVAVCLLHAYANPENEVATQRLISKLRPSLRISLSSSVLPQVGEHGRLSTTVTNAYVQPLVERYLGDIENALTAEGSRAAFFVMGSNGGTLSVDVAKQFPVKLVESGPAAGACVASFYGQLTQNPKVLAFDMGGTTAKICLIKDGQPTRTTEFEVARVRRFQKGSGLLLKVPAVDLIEIGAGGGSIARVDKLGLLAVGPESAGAQPGPACYARGGEQPTVTDADLLLGYLNREYFLGGEMQLDLKRAAMAIQRGVAEPLGVQPVEAARSVYEVVNDNMANAATVYAAEQGVDLRDYSLFAFGGAAPAHAWDVARRLRIRRVVVPFSAGVLSALGCVLSPLTFDFVLGHMRALEDVDWRHINDAYAAMERQGREWLDNAGVRDGITVSWSADMRYLGQRYEVTVPLPGEAPLGEHHVQAVAHEFYDAYRRQYGREILGVPVEAVTWRLTVAGPRPEVDLRWRDSRLGGEKDGDRDPGLKGRRPVFFAQAGGHVDSLVYDRYALAPGACILGPAVVEDRDSTAVVPPRAVARVDEFNSLVIELEVGDTAP
jgi:N-methylhydantoinase A